MIDQFLILLQSISIISVGMVGVLIYAVNVCEQSCKNKLIVFLKGLFFILTPLVIVLMGIMLLELLLGGLT